MYLCAIVSDILRNFSDRFDKMPLTSSWIKVIFIILAITLYSVISSESPKLRHCVKKELIHTSVDQLSSLKFKSLELQTSLSTAFSVSGRSGGDAVEVALVCHIAVRTAAETAFVPLRETRETPECNVYVDRLHFCTREMDPICATNGRTYSNKCVFCSEKL
ncbi:hypothetical protein DBR06_SOUSAS810242 [Sousa chinensis]|uniref:Kazal-like domain-containing protein n=1 Tax=Sousa chinensis TaxID=103600 RepID=A0A484GLT9_SOUCH|nr:hypothetical protein DBR06_SOUSAS810242 [Sousa chinensis]